MSNFYLLSHTKKLKKVLFQGIAYVYEELSKSIVAQWLKHSSWKQEKEDSSPSYYHVDSTRHKLLT